MFYEIKAKRKVLVGLSGGVDSSVAAFLLKKSGLNVVGAYMKSWDYDDPVCTGSQDENMARITASKIGIPFYVFDFRKDYKKRVFSYFLEEYKKGRTPNPDVMCNRYIKFGIFIEKAIRLGFDYIATGHYARIYRGKILKGKDKDKDQSYFLSFIKKEVLNKIIFPLGNYTKEKVREIAKKAKLPSANRVESQGICFIGEVKMDEFLKRYIKPKKGLIVDKNGRKLGYHQGIYFYTIGQRKGIGLPGGPYYVLNKDLKNNILVVTNKKKELFRKELIAINLNWLAEDVNFKKKIKAEAVIRYRQKPLQATIIKINDKYKIKFDIPQWAVAPGQIIVFYKKQQMLGSAVIFS